MLLKIYLIIAISYISYIYSTKCRDGSYCPRRQTCCLALYGVGCCPYEDAICCGDGEHCCPNGFICGRYSCYKESGDANLAYFLSNAKENTNTESKQSNSDKEEEQSTEKINKTLLNFSTNTRNDQEKNTNEINNLTFLDENNKKKEEAIVSSTSSMTTTTVVKEDNKGTITASIETISKFTSILDKISFLNNSFFKKFLNCFKDVEPVFKDLMNAYNQKNEDKTESLMKVLTDLVQKLYFDGSKINSDCKALLTLAGFAGLF